MLDSGVRRGSDILAALCRGASFISVVRPTLYAVVAAGEAGLRHAIETLRSEIDTTLGLIGCSETSPLGTDFLYSETEIDPVRPAL